MPHWRNVYVIYQVLFKLDSDGHGKEIRRRNLGSNEDLSFVGWTDEMVSFYKWTLIYCEQHWMERMLRSLSSFVFLLGVTTVLPYLELEW